MVAINVWKKQAAIASRNTLINRSYFFAGSTRIAMRDDGVHIYLLSDHLGSTSLTTDAGGGVLRCRDGSGKCLVNSFVIFILLVAVLMCSSCIDQDTDNENLRIAITEISPSDLPNYLSRTSPWPGTTLSIEEYNSLPMALGWGGNSPGVCIRIGPIPFLEEGDFYTAEEWIDERVEILVDEMSLGKPASLLLTNSLGVEKYDVETGKLIWREPNGTPIAACYAVDLGIGLHEAEVIVETTSGHRTGFIWQFLITQ